MKRLLATIVLFSIPAFLLAQNNSLDFYIGQALQNSPLLKDYKNQLQSNLADSELIVAGYKPQVTGTSFNSYAPVIKGIGYDYAITNGGTFATLVGVNKTIVNPKKREAEFDNIRLQNEAVSNTAKLSEQDLKRTISAQYITAWSDQLQLDFNKEIYDLLKKEEVILKTLTQNNVYRQTDYLSFLVTLQQQNLLLKQLHIQFQNDFASLNYSCGIMDTGFAKLQEPGITMNSLPDISGSAFFQQFAIDSLKLNNSRSLVDFSYKPKINLFADGGFNSSLAYNAYKNFGTSFGVSLSVPIYDGKQKKIQYSKLSIAERTRSGYKDFYTSQYNQQLAQLKQQLAATDELLQQINEQVKYSETLINADSKLLQDGQVTMADYIIAINNYLNAKNLLTQNKVARLQIINQYNYWNR